MTFYIIIAVVLFVFFYPWKSPEMDKFFEEVGAILGILIGLFLIHGLPGLQYLSFGGGP